jgi:hypothetical protein
MQPSGTTFPVKPRFFLPRLLRISPVPGAMVSAAVLAQASQRELVVIWRADHHCGCRLLDLFDYPGPVIKDGRAGQLRSQSARVYNYMEIEEGAQYLEEITPQDIKGDLYIRSAYSLVSPQVDFAAKQPFLKFLIPARPKSARALYPASRSADRGGGGQLFPRRLYGRSARQLQYALADLLLLTFADKLLAGT